MRSCIGIYSVPSDSMAPALQPGDRIVATRLPGRQVERGDVVVFRDPADSRRLSVKRVIGLPGDLVESRDGRVFVSGRAVAGTWGTHPPSAQIPPQIVPGGYLFVLGDNRVESWDSRHWGPLPASLVVGRARVVLWQRDGRRIFKWIE